MRRPLIIIFITVFIDLVGFGIVIPVLPLYANQFGASPSIIGLLLGVFSAMQFIFAPILGRLSDRIGRRPVLLVSLIGTSAGFIMMGLAETLWLLFVARIIDGITGGNISIAQAYIADVTPPERRSRAMGIIGAAFGLGFIFGPAIGGIMSHVSPGAPFFFAAALAAANATALYLFLPESLPQERRAASGPRPSILHVLRNSGRLGPVFATYFFATVAFALLTATYSLFTNGRLGYDAAMNGYLFAYLGLLGAVVQGGLLGHLLKIFGDKRLTMLGIALMAASMFALPSSYGLSVLLIASTGISFGHSFVTPTLNGMASNSASAMSQGQVLGVMQSVASLARIVGPVLGGLLLSYDAAGPAETFGRATFWTGGAIMLLALLVALQLPAGRKAEVDTVNAEPTAAEELVGHK